MICQAARLHLADGRTVFAKWGDDLPDGLLDVEADGLRWLRRAGAAAVPEVHAVTPDVLVLEWIEPGPTVAGTGELLGRGLAGLHRAGAEHFGWHRPGFIGTVPQDNSPHHSWPEFWITRRLGPLARRARDRGAVDAEVPALVDRLADRIGELAGPEELPARVHGDLWSGNVHVDRQGTPWLVDPAPYGGHREVDLAMLHLFGRPPSGFVEAYNEVFPLTEGWRDRLPLWQLEPLLVHAVLFGGHYGSSVRSTLRRFT
jgi:fructosamine-3-kinase